MTRFLGSVPAQRWTPTELGSTVIAWYDASDASTITLVSGVVSQWDDKSGNGKNLTQGTASLRPSVSSADLNGLDTVRFQSDWLATSSNIFSSTSVTAMHAYMVARAPETGRITFNAQISFNGDNDATRFLIAIPGGAKNSAEHYWNHSGTNTYIVIGSQSASEFPEYLLTVSKGATNATARLFTSTGNHTSSGTDGTGTASTLRVGGITAGVWEFPTDWKLAELIVCSAEQGTADRDRVEGYLAWKWGLVSYLDSGHTYKTQAP